MSGEQARERFASLLQETSAEVRLDEVALTIALSEYPDLDVELYLQRLDRMADELRPRLQLDEPAERQITLLSDYLFREREFAGNAADYYDPRNSYLSDVLDRRTGIPITLSLLYMELGRRLNLPIEGVGLPGHFIVRCTFAPDQLLIDPFHRGAIVTIDDCRDRVTQLYGGRLAFSGELLRPVSPREIVRRMLGNLKGCYVGRGDLVRAARSVEWSLIADSSRAEDLRELALLRFRLGELRTAIDGLERFLERQPTGPLAEQTQEVLKQVQALWIRRN